VRYRVGGGGGERGKSEGEERGGGKREGKKERGGGKREGEGGERERGRKREGKKERERERREKSLGDKSGRWRKPEQQCDETNLEAEHEVELHAVLVKHANADKTAENRVTLEKTADVLQTRKSVSESVCAWEGAETEGGSETQWAKHGESGERRETHTHPRSLTPPHAHTFSSRVSSSRAALRILARVYLTRQTWRDRARERREEREEREERREKREEREEREERREKREKREERVSRMRFAVCAPSHPVPAKAIPRTGPTLGSTVRHRTPLTRTHTHTHTRTLSFRNTPRSCCGDHTLRRA
jgi:hypothetical protein